MFKSSFLPDKILVFTELPAFESETRALVSLDKPAFIWRGHLYFWKKKETENEINILKYNAIQVCYKRFLFHLFAFFQFVCVSIR